MKLKELQHIIKGSIYLKFNSDINSKYESEVIDSEKFNEINKYILNGDVVEINSVLNFSDKTLSPPITYILVNVNWENE